MKANNWLPKVCEWLDLHSLSAVSQVCHEWHNVVRVADSVWINQLSKKGWQPRTKTTPFLRFCRLMSLNRAVKSPCSFPTVTTLSTEAPVLCVTFCGNTLNIGGMNGDLIKWLPPQLQRFHVTDFPLYSLGFDRKSRWIAVGTADGVVHSWQLQQQGKPEEEAGNNSRSTTTTTTKGGQHTASIRKVVVVGDVAYSASKDGTLRKWDFKAGGASVAEFTGHAKQTTVHCLAVCEARGLLFSGGSDHQVFVWDINDPRRKAVLSPSHNGWVTCIACNNEHLVSASAADLRVWPMLQADCLDLHDCLDWPYQLLTGHRTMINCIAFTGNHIVSGGNDGLVCVWELKDTTNRFSFKHMLRGHSDWVNCLACHPSAPVVATGDSEGRVLLWDFEKGSMLRVCQETTSIAILDIAFSKQRLAFGDWHGTVKCFDFGPKREKEATATDLCHQPQHLMQQQQQQMMTTEERLIKFPHSALLKGVIASKTS